MRDELTGLPTLIGVLPDLTKRIEKEKSIKILFVQLIESSLYEEEFGFDVYDSWIKSLSKIIKDFAIKEFSTVENPIIFVSEPFSSLIGLAFPSQHNDKNFKKYLRDEISEKIPAPFEITIKEITYEPLKRTERIIYETINKVKFEHLKAETTLKVNIKSLLRKIIRKGEIGMVFQPIYNISEKEEKPIIFGYEALARGPRGTELEMPTTLFSVADELGELESLEKICRWKALLTSKKLADRGMMIFINTSSKILQSETRNITQEIIDTAKEIGFDYDKIVVEITERYAIREYKTLKENIKKLKDNGIKISIDDVGVGYSSLQTLAELSPDFLKYDMVLVRNIHKDLIKQNLLEMILNFGERIKAPVIAEGIEKKEELEAIKKLGVKFAQGFYLSEPFEVEL